MNLTINQLPKKWNPDSKLAFIKWMQKIKNIHYYKID